LDHAGNLYGTTYGIPFVTYGTVFELIPSGSGWTEKTLYTFEGGSDGGWSTAGLVFDSAGNLYGDTTEVNGNPQAGVAFQLSPSGGNWTYSVIYTFNGCLATNLAFDDVGNLYGTTASGGATYWGSVFKLSPSNGNWLLTELYYFSDQGNGGFFPRSNVVFDAAGNLYGTASAGGTGNGGVVWSIAP